MNNNDLTNYVSGMVELNDGWEIESFRKNGDLKKCMLKYNNTDNKKNDFYKFDFIRYDFMGMRVHFFISIPKKTKKITEPFKKENIDINNEYEKWHYKDIFIDSLPEIIKTKPENKTKLFNSFREIAWKFEGVNDNISERIYKTLKKLNDPESRYRYAKFLRKQGNFKEAIKNLDKSSLLLKEHKDQLHVMLSEKKSFENNMDKINKEINVYFKKNQLDNILKKQYETSLSYCKEKKYHTALSIMEELIDYYFINEKKYFNQIFYFLVLLRKKFNSENSEINNYLDTNPNKEKLKKYSEKIYDLLNSENKKKRTSGILIWIDFVDSSGFKYNHEKIKDPGWQALFLYFLTMTTVIFNSIEYTTLKYIGDEIMLFKAFNEENIEEKIQAKQIYDFLFDKQKWYFEEIERFSPRNKNKHYKIRVNICISVVRNVFIVNDLKNDILNEKKINSIFDILGPDVDLSARIKKLAKENFVVADEKFVTLLEENGGDYSKKFKEFKWKDTFKGINEEITYYGKEIKRRKASGT
jgi:hypothetical protein